MTLCMRRAPRALVPGPWWTYPPPMAVHRLERLQVLTRPREEVFAFFERAENLARITPDFVNFEITTPTPIEMGEGALIDYRIRLFGVPMRWRTRIEEYRSNDRFVDTQVRGPYAVWRHTHLFADVPGGTEMRDIVEYEVPLGLLGSVARRLFVARTLDRIFDHRAEAIAQIFER